MSHCAWRRVISLSKATKKRSKESAFKTRARKLTQRAVPAFLAPQKHGACKSDGCVNPSFSEHGYPHASPPVTEPAKEHPALSAENHPSNLYACRTTWPTHRETRPQGWVRPRGLFGNGACPRAYRAKRVRVRIREKEGFKHPWFWRAPCFWGAKNAQSAR